ncbi:MAG: sigma-70 family RNA polymerase sigma factor [Actinomycetota bacterium]
MTIMELHQPIDERDRTGDQAAATGGAAQRNQAGLADAERSAGFDRLFEDRHRPMLRLATGLVDQPSVAEDVVQEAFQRVWIRWHDLEQPAVYLRTAVVNGCNDELRKRRVRRKTDPTLRPSAPAEAHYLVDALSSIAPRRRKAIVLRFYGGHTLPEVAEVMGIPTGTAKSLVHRGLADLRGALAA